MNIYTPYTYLIGWTKYNLYYYGCQYGISANPNNLWKTYFTSSKKVKQIRKEYGEPDILQIRKTFSNADHAKLWETKVLTRIKAIEKDVWLNANVSGKYYKPISIDKEYSRRKKISSTKKSSPHPYRNLPYSETPFVKGNRYNHTKYNGHSEQTCLKMSIIQKNLGLYKGEKNPKSKVSEEDVLDIRKQWDNYTGIQKHFCVELSDVYNCTPELIRNIIKRNTWKHI